MFEQEHLRFINMFTAAGSGGHGGGCKHPNAVMEDKGTENLIVVNGDKSLFRQGHQKFTTALGQVGGARVEILHRLVGKIRTEKKVRR
jgi:hypothetical protein